MDTFIREKRVIRLGITRHKDQIDGMLKKKMDIELLSKLESYIELGLLPAYKSYCGLVDDITKLIDPDNDAHIKVQDDMFTDRDVVTDIVASYEGKVRACGVKMISMKESTSRQSIVGGDSSLNSSIVGGSSFGAQLKLAKIDCTITPSLVAFRSCIVGEAEKVLRDCEWSEESYADSWSSFLAAFENKRAIIEAHFRNLKNLDSISTDLGLRSLMNQVSLIIRGLKACGETIDNTFSKYVAYLVSSKLDASTLKDWRHSLKSTATYPLYVDLEDFLRIRAFACEDREMEERTWPSEKKSTSGKKSFSVSKTIQFTSSSSVCVVCQDSHRIYECKEFWAMNPRERFEVVKSNRLCINCLAKGHSVKECNRSKCKSCGGAHNTALHFEKSNSPSSPSKLIPTERKIESKFKSIASFSSCLLSSSSDKLVLLPTAVVRIVFQGHKPIFPRALLDSGSQVTFVSDSLVRKLKIQTRRLEKSSQVTGIGAIVHNSTHFCNFQIRSRDNKFKLEIEADVIANIPYHSPLGFLEKLKTKHSHKVFADDCMKNSEVEIILGAEYIETCLLDESIVEGQLKLRDSQFGYIISGFIENQIPVNSNIRTCQFSTSTIEETLKKFWELEEVSLTNVSLSEQELCVDHFNKTVDRNSEGRFVVRLPLKDDISKLADTMEYAKRALVKVEKSSNQDIKLEYNKFLQEYVSLGHMEKLPVHEKLNHSYIIPHRAVLSPSSSTTRLCVVFNASAKAGSGKSLNEILMLGPSIHPDLFEILVRFRSYKLAVTADIEKMYRQVLIDDQDCNLQCILWRNTPDEEISTYRLKTITYGTTPASFLATNCLQILGTELKQTDPEAGEIIRRNFYMDDLLAGANRPEELLVLCSTIHKKLASAGFNLRKYASNSQILLDSLEDGLAEKSKTINFDGGIVVSTLGIKWNSNQDEFKMQLNVSALPEIITKRVMLSYISRQFDPLGFIAPVSIRGKILLQELWREGVTWDQSVSPELEAKFREYLEQLQPLSNFSLNRYYTNLENCVNSQLIGFCDASPLAYCAVVYHRCEDSVGNVSSYIICAKTRVAPIKALTIPRLELQGALLLVELINRVRSILHVEPSNIYCYTDSMIVLGWLGRPPDTWQLYVRNRVAKILSIISKDNWLHINGKENPADLATRGISSQSLLQNKLWLHGPEFILSSLDNLKKQDLVKIDLAHLPERSPNSVQVAFLIKPGILPDISSYVKLLNVICYVNRFVNSTRSKCRYGSILSSEERNLAFKYLIRYIQSIYFKQDLEFIQKSDLEKCTFKSLTPFIDKDGLIRVGGRLINLYSFDKCHPIIVPSKCHFFRIFVRHVHEKYFHASHLFVNSFILSRLWPIEGYKKVIKSVLFSCIICRRFRAETYNKIMGQLPHDRIAMSRPFSSVGVDFAGPFVTKCTGHRSLKLNKSYIAVFVCFVTRAIHIEVVSDLSTVMFLAVFRRFISRRGLPRKVHSDNGTNFVGANNLILLGNESLGKFVSEEQIHWSFIPPRSPHHGGIWEAAVKSFKYHFVRLSLGITFTLEEFHTVSTQIEAILNSRPLCYQSGVQFEQSIITPAHFIAGSSLIELPQEENMSLSIGKKWLKFRRIITSFWRVWRADYLAQLQRKSKWTKSSSGPLVGDIVLVKDDVTERQKWPLGKVERVYPDSTGAVRIVDVKLSSGIKRRSIVKLIPLVEADLLTPMVSRGGEC